VSPGKIAAVRRHALVSTADRLPTRIATVKACAARQTLPTAAIAQPVEHIIRNAVLKVYYSMG
jgi:hypothetical protein